MKKCAILLLITTLLLTGCAGDTTTVEATESETEDVQSTEVTFTDDLGREVTVDNPQRVATLLGSFADMWVLAGGTVQASADIQKAVNEDPGNQVYRAAYQQINRSSQTYQRNARTYQSNFGGLGGLCCSMALSQMLCGHPCFFCFC